MKSLITAIVIVLGSHTFSQAAEAPAAAKASSGKLISAITGNDHALFQAQGDETFSKAITKDLFDQVQAQLAPRLKAGHEMIYLTEINRLGNKVTLWKLTFKDGGDDAIATLSMKNGKVAGFFIQ
jgi:hypothetical protein